MLEYQNNADSENIGRLIMINTNFNLDAFLAKQ